MNNFENITVSPETLGKFLASLPAAGGPWEEEFHRMFCDGCPAENCNDENCPHNAERNNPTWWLKLGEKQGEVLGLSIRVKAVFPVLWRRECYTVAEKKKETRAPNAIKIKKKRTPGASGTIVPGAIFLHCFVWDIAQMTAVFP